MRRIVAYLLTAIVTVFMAGCSSKETIQEIASTPTDNSVTNTPEATAESNTLQFETANCLKFELSKRDDQSFDDIIATFKVENKGEKTIDYLSADFAYYDKNGDQICKDSRFQDCQLDKNKSCFMKSYSILDGKKKSEVKVIKVNAYTYYIGDKIYNINLELETAEVISQDISNDAEFEKVNLVQFELQDKGIDSIHSYEVDVKLRNKTKDKIVTVTYDMAYFDKERNVLYTDCRFVDDVLRPGKATISKSFCDEEVTKQVASFGIYKYTYKLKEDDQKGFNEYEINLQTKTVKGYHRE